MVDVQTEQQLLTQSNGLLSFLLVKKNIEFPLKSTVVALTKNFHWWKEDGLLSILGLSVCVMQCQKLAGLGFCFMLKSVIFEALEDFQVCHFELH